MIIWVSALACVAFLMKHILSAQAQALVGFWIQGVQIIGMLHNIGGGVDLGCRPVWAKQGQKKYWYWCCQRMNPKITSCCMPYSSVNLFMTEKTYILFSNVWASKRALLYDCFNRDVQLELDSRIWPSRLNQVFLVTEFIYDKTDLFWIISVYINADVYFGCVINCCEEKTQ